MSLIDAKNCGIFYYDICIQEQSNLELKQVSNIPNKCIYDIHVCCICSHTQYDLLI